MKRYLLVLSTLLCTFAAFSQLASSRISAAFQQFEADSQLRSAISSLYVINAKTGEVVFEKNGKIGLATASTMKIITAASAYELLGRDFRYKTEFAIGDNKNSLNIFPSGDPTFGSWRWKESNESSILKELVSRIKKEKIKSFSGIAVDNSGWNSEAIPDGWIWQDVGNYYGAGAVKLNWGENQFDVVLKSGNNVGEPVSILHTKPKLYNYELSSDLISAERGTGDNAYIYLPAGSPLGSVRGTIPINESNFIISGAMTSPDGEMIGRLCDTLMKEKIYNPENAIVFNGAKPNDKLGKQKMQVIYTYVSPSLDSIVYWFLKRSINLYGEALIKTIAYKTTGKGSTDEGTGIIRNFWKSKGVDPVELKMEDGSGLSPLNRVTTHAQVQVLRYAKSQPWFRGYFNGFPEYNGMKMKSGTINGVKGFCGYQTSKDGTEYIFSFLVNNYNGSANRLVQKMYKVLDELK